MLNRIVEAEQYKIMDCVIREFLVKKNIDYFKNHLDFIESSIKEAEKQLKQEQEFINKLVAEKGEALDSMEDYLVCLDEDHERLKRTVYQSFAISIFTFIEAKIINVQKIQNEFFANAELKNEFDVVKEIRNILLHEKGKISHTARDKKKKKEKTKVKDFVEKHQDFLEINESGEVIIKFEYLKSLIVLTQNVCTEISK